MKLLDKQVESGLTEFSKILLSMLTTREDNILLCYCSCLKDSFLSYLNLVIVTT